MKTFNQWLNENIGGGVLDAEQIYKLFIAQNPDWSDPTLKGYVMKGIIENPPEHSDVANNYKFYMHMLDKIIGNTMQDKPNQGTWHTK